MTKALFFDIDGTLVSFKTHVIPDSTRKAILTARAKGIKTFTASGRPLQLLNNLGSMIDGLFDGYVLASGAHCILDGKTVRKDLIPREEVLSLMQFCDERKIPYVLVGVDDLQYCNVDDNMRRVWMDMLKVTYNKFDVPVMDVVDQGILQMTPFLTEEQESIILPELKTCISSRWYPAFCDITSSAANKANGIRSIAEAMGIDIDKTMAFGDGGNDIPMLEAAGISVAMGNAIDVVKAKADYVTSSVDDDGIWNALHHFDIV